MPDRFLSVEECVAEIEKTVDPHGKEVYQNLKEIVENGEYAVMVNDDGPEPLFYTVRMDKPILFLNGKRISERKIFDS